MNESENQLPGSFRVGFLVAGIFCGFWLIDAFMFIPIFLLVGWIGTNFSTGKTKNGLKFFTSGMTLVIFASVVAMILTAYLGGTH